MTPTRLGPYLLERELGSGGMGSVYAGRVEGRAPGLAPGTRVAVKVVHRHLFDRPGLFKRFLREAEIGRRVQSPHVVRVLDYDALQGTHFLVMEYVEGQTLLDLAAELERLPDGLCRHLGAAIAAGLAAIHAEGTVHRDLKPENVLVTDDRTVKVMDLGVARVIGEQLSETGAFIGSVEYASPEQFTGGVDHRADLHALGVVLYELASGHHPFRGGTFAEVMRNVREHVPRRLSEREPAVSPLLDALVTQLLQKSASDRIQTADEVHEILTRGEESAWWRSQARTVEPERERPRRRMWIARETAVHGRDPELRRLRELFGDVASGQGRVVLLGGEAGVGKSRLMDEFVRRLDEDEAPLHFLLGSYPPGGAAAGVGAFAEAFHAHLGDRGAADHLKTTPSLVPAFDALLSGAEVPSGAERVGREGLQAAFVRTLRSIASDRPTVLLIEDLHNAPDAGLALFAALAVAVRGHRVLLVGSHRRRGEVELGTDLARYEHVRRIELGRLHFDDLTALLREHLASDLKATHLGRVVAERAGGNPFFALEILRGLRERGLIRRVDTETWISTSAVERIEIPGSVRDVVRARISELEETERELLDLAACFGHRFDPVLIGDALGLSRIPALRTLGRVERRCGLIHARGLEFEFDHHQIQETLYDALSAPLRREYHSLLADALTPSDDAGELGGADAVQLAHHLIEAGRFGEGARHVGQASGHLIARYRPAEAATLLTRVLEQPGAVTGRARIGLTSRLCVTLDTLARHEEQEHWARDAFAHAEELDDAQARAAALMALGISLLRQVRHEDAEREFERAREVAEGAGSDSQAASILLNHAISLHSRGALAEAKALYLRCLASCRELGKDRSVAAVLGNLGSLAYLEGRIDEARQAYDDALEIHDRVGNRQGALTVRGNLAVLHKNLGELDRAVELYTQCMRDAEEIGYRRGEAMNVANLGVAYQEQGRLAQAARCTQRSIEINTEVGYLRNHGHDLNNLALIRQQQGRIDEALELAAEALEFGRHRKLPIVEGYALRIQVRTAYESERTEGLVDAARASVAHAAGMEFRLLEPWTRHDLAEVLVDDDPKAAADEWEVVLQQAREQESADLILLATCHLAALGRIEIDPALRTLEETNGRVGAAALRDALFALWRATGDDSHRGRAKTLLDEAIRLAESDEASMVDGLRGNRRIRDA